MFYLNEFIRFLFKSLWAFILYTSWSCLFTWLFVTNFDFWRGSAAGSWHGPRPGRARLWGAGDWFCCVISGAETDDPGVWHRGLGCGQGRRSSGGGWAGAVRPTAVLRTWHTLNRVPGWAGVASLALGALRWVPGRASACALGAGVGLAACTLQRA